jgi:hypothetical protein
LNKVVESLSEKNIIQDNKNCCQCPCDIDGFKNHLDKKIESLQDVLYVRDTLFHSESEELKSRLKVLEMNLSEKFMSLSNQVQDLNVNENNRFEHVKRRLGDFYHTTQTIHNKLNSIIEPEYKESPPHLQYNNPFLNVQANHLFNQPPPEVEKVSQH